MNRREVAKQKRIDFQASVLLMALILQLEERLKTEGLSSATLEIFMITFAIYCFLRSVCKSSGAKQGTYRYLLSL